MFIWQHLKKGNRKGLPTYVTTLGHVTSSTSKDYKHHSKSKRPHSLKLLLYHCIDYQAGITVAPGAPSVMNKAEMIGPEEV